MRADALELGMHREHVRAQLQQQAEQLGRRLSLGAGVRVGARALCLDLHHESTI
jgi:hypothetical protein